MEWGQQRCSSVLGGPVTGVGPMTPAILSVHVHQRVKGMLGGPPAGAAKYDKDLSSHFEGG